MSVRCESCGLTNFPSAVVCRRCSGALAASYPGAPAWRSPPGPTGEDPRDVELRAEARNYLFLGAALTGLVPLVALVFAASQGKGDAPSIELAVALLTGPALLVIAGVLCHRGHKAAMWVAALPLLVMMLGFPVGTIAAFFIASKVSRAAKLGALH